VSDAVAQLEALRSAHAELLRRHESVVASHSDLEQNYKRAEQVATSAEQSEREFAERSLRLERENAVLRAQYKALLQRLYGKRSEKLDGMQHELFEEAHGELDAEARERELAATETEPAIDPPKPKQRRKRGHGNLPRVRVVVDLPESERCCPCCEEVMQPFGEEVSEELDYVPAVVRIVETARTKYSCPQCHEGVVVAPANERPIPRVTAGAGLLAHVAVSKFGYHLPLYRLEQMLGSQGAEISRKQMCGWMGAVADLLEPVVGEMKRAVLSEPLIQCDETTLRYQDRSRIGTTGRGYLWAYSKPWAEVVFDFQTGRSRAGPSAFLAEYRGAVQADGYAGYNEVVRKNENIRVACMAHIRRKIFEARAEYPEWAELLLAGIQRLYRIERRAKSEGVGGEALLELRSGEPTKILGVLGEVMTDLVEQTLPQSGFGKAMRYGVEQWPSMRNYTLIAEAELDNNGVESAIRPIALGRKNWLFAGSEDGGRRAAILFSLVTSAKRLGIDPFEYLSDVIARVGEHKNSRIEELTPRGWKAARS
jgi:transposase